VEGDSDQPALRTVFQRTGEGLRPASRPARPRFTAEELGLTDLPWGAGAMVW
jgi:hypothetical protein